MQTDTIYVFFFFTFISELLKNSLGGALHWAMALIDFISFPVLKKFTSESREKKITGLFRFFQQKKNNRNMGSKLLYILYSLPKV